MKAAYFSNYRDGTYDASFGVDNILALEAAGVDIVCRPVTLSAMIPDLPCPVEHLERKTLNDVDVIIQDMKPHLYEYKGGVKNIGFLRWNQSSFHKSNWPECCNLMDEIWVTSTDTMLAASKSGISKPIKMVLHGRNSDKFKKQINPLPLDGLKHKCVFYTISDMTRLQNVTGLIRAYYAAFTKTDDVVLLLRIYDSSRNEGQLVSLVRETIEDIKKTTHIYPELEDYPKIAIICGILNDDQLYQLHKNGDIFVTANRGEFWNIFLHDAMGFGRPPIYTNICGQASLAINLGWPISGQPTPCVDTDSNEDGLITGKDYWFDPNLCDLAESFKDAYQSWQNNKLGKIQKDVVKAAIAMNYQHMGNFMKQKLELGESE